MHLQSSSMKSEKQRKRKTDLSPGTLEFPRITQQPTNTIHLSLGFASGTLGCFLFQHEVLPLLSFRTETRVSISTGGGTSSKWVEEGQGRPRSSRAIRCYGWTRGTAGSDRWRSAMELRFLSMADRGREQEYGSLEGHREPDGVEGRWRRVNEEVGSASGCPNATWSTSRGAAMVGRALVHGIHVLATRRPLRLFDEQVAGIKVSKVGRQFGPLPGQIWTWAKNEVCSPRPALQL
jgi:hypothetical protein